MDLIENPTEASVAAFVTMLAMSLLRRWFLDRALMGFAARREALVAISGAVALGALAGVGVLSGVPEGAREVLLAWLPTWAGATLAHSMFWKRIESWLGKPGGKE